MSLNKAVLKEIVGMSLQYQLTMRENSITLQYYFCWSAMM